jgi:hypothetical protein
VDSGSEDWIVNGVSEHGTVPNGEETNVCIGFIKFGERNESAVIKVIDKGADNAAYYQYNFER